MRESRPYNRDFVTLESFFTPPIYQYLHFYYLGQPTSTKVGQYLSSNNFFLHFALKIHSIVDPLLFQFIICYADWLLSLQKASYTHQSKVPLKLHQLSHSRSLMTTENFSLERAIKFIKIFFTIKHDSFYPNQPKPHFTMKRKSTGFFLK